MVGKVFRSVYTWCILSHSQVGTWRRSQWHLGLHGRSHKSSLLRGEENTRLVDRVCVGHGVTSSLFAHCLACVNSR